MTYDILNFAKTGKFLPEKDINYYMDHNLKHVF